MRVPVPSRTRNGPHRRCQYQETHPEHELGRHRRSYQLILSEMRQDGLGSMSRAWYHLDVPLILKKKLHRHKCNVSTPRLKFFQSPCAFVFGALGFCQGTIQAVKGTYCGLPLSLMVDGPADSCLARFTGPSVVSLLTSRGRFVPVTVSTPRLSGDFLGLPARSPSRARMALDDE
ncbi:hypothetical protein EDB92DRAFT_1481165 [Lactarius akahatsu]|uniref:Uncharacterized protein n=1 Tax=Lactarius akahatsu TaxID=416441 RepID=A0AAD4L8J4_9AGAM|nr:hypothetical protein EDB92DRAFT_1481165 [Lactarius akahatsu]